MRFLLGALLACALAVSADGGDGFVIARHLWNRGCDVIVHIGHVDFGVKTCLPVVYEPYEFSFDPVPLLVKNKFLMLKVNCWE